MKSAKAKAKAKAKRIKVRAIDGVADYVVNGIFFSKHGMIDAIFEYVALEDLMIPFDDSGAGYGEMGSLFVGLFHDRGYVWAT